MQTFLYGLQVFGVAHSDLHISQLAVLLVLHLHAGQGIVDLQLIDDDLLISFFIKAPQTAPIVRLS